MVKGVGPARSALAAAVLLMLLITGCTKPVHELVANAQAYRAKGETSAAVISLLNAIKQAPANSQAHLLLCSIYADMGEAGKAETELRTAIATGAGPEDYLPPLGTALLDQEKFNELIAEVGRLDEKKLAANTVAEIALQRGRAYLGLVKPVDARREFKAALGENPAAAYLGLAQTAMAENNLVDAEKFSADALAAAPGDPNAWVAKGDLLRIKSKPDEALAAFDQALKFKPDFVPALLSRASLLLISGKVDAARAELDKAAKIAPASAKLHFSWAVLALREQKFERCRDELNGVFRVIPQHMPATLLSGALFLATGQLEQAQTAAITFLQRYPAHIYGRKILATILLRKGQPKSAAYVLEPLLPVIKDDAQLLSLAAQAQLQIGNTENSRDLLEKAVAVAPGDPELRIDLGLSRLAAGDSERAIAELEFAVGLNPGDVLPEVYLVNVLIAGNELEKAAAAVDALEKRLPGKPETYQLRGAVYLGKLDKANAQKSFERALAIKPSYYPAVAALNQMDIRNNNSQSAQQRLEVFLTKDNRNLDAMLDLANLQVAAGKIKEATQMLRAALDAYPRAVQAYLMLSQLSLQAGQTQDALTVAQIAQQISPKDARVLDALGTAQLAAGDAMSAIITFRRMLEVAPRSVPGLLKLAGAYTAQRETPQAIAAIKQAVEIDPANIDVQISLAVAYLNTKRYSEAAAIASTLKKERPKLPHGYALDADVQFAQGHYADALKAFEQAEKIAPSGVLRIRMHQAASLLARSPASEDRLVAWLKERPDDFNTRLYVADLYLEAARYKEAIAEYRILLAKNSRHVRVLNNLAWALHETGDRSALQYAQEATQFDPANGVAADTLGWILVGQDKPTDGLVSLSRAASLLPDVPEIKYHIAEALFRTGDLNGSRSQLKSLLASGAKFKGIENARALQKKLELMNSQEKPANSSL